MFEQADFQFMGTDTDEPFGPHLIGTVEITPVEMLFDDKPEVIGWRGEGRIELANQRQFAEGRFASGDRVYFFVTVKNQVSMAMCAKHVFGDDDAMLRVLLLGEPFGWLH